MRIVIAFSVLLLIFVVIPSLIAGFSSSILRKSVLHIGVLLIAFAPTAVRAEAIAKSLKTFRSEDYKLSRQAVAWTTNDWKDFLPTTGAFPSFTFKYPSNWEFNGHSVFSINNGHKIAELSPGIVKLNKGQECFDNIDIDKGDNPKIQLIRVGKLKGKKIETLTILDGSSDLWTVNSYCLSDGKYAFLIMFYTDSKSKESKKIFDSLVSSFHFNLAN